LSLHDPNGKAIIQEMIAAAAQRDQVELDYASHTREAHPSGRA
jgi:hypothetical protein